MALVNKNTYQKTEWITSNGVTPYTFESGKEPDAIINVSSNPLAATFTFKYSNSGVTLVLNTNCIYPFKVKSILGSISSGVLLATWY